MSSAIIQVENLSKKYRIRHQAEGRRYVALRDVIADKVKRLFQGWKTKNVPRKSVEDFWALKDVSFEIKQGEVVGIIGRNGAGKSTLLKVLSRITEPTEGRVCIDGRVASLLEVGTGFHPELTGRENIFLNGAILGMSRVEIKRKFDEIVAFAEGEKFLDTPVKHYSSGMYVRLAFAVAAHLEPEILIVDEVLAVGDGEFQKKCLGKMGEVSKCGRTVLVVSHNMAVIKRLCSSAILLEKGRIVATGKADDTVAAYMNTGVFSQTGEVNFQDWTDRTGNANARFIAARLKNSQNELCNNFDVDETIYLELDIEYKRDLPGLSHTMEIRTADGTPLYHFWDLDSRKGPLPQVRRRTIKIKVENLNLYPGRYFISLWVGNIQLQQAEDTILNCISFSVEQVNAAIRRPLLDGTGQVWKRSEWTFIEPGQS
jgi:lipopolysaccharide transport system ATP-binding protein